MVPLASIAANFSGGLITALAFLTVLTVVVFVHELGHFLVARWCGVKVKAFSIGFGREIVGFTDKHGTRWKIAPIPLGGYVKFMDDENAASVPSREQIEAMSPEERAGSFHAKPVWQRAAVVAAGPLVNFLFAIVIFAAWAMVFGIHLVQPRVGEVSPDSPAARAGIKAGDLIKTMAGRDIASFEDIQKIVTVNVGRALPVTVDRGGTPVSLTVTPELKTINDGAEPAQTRVVIGIMGPRGAENVVSYYPNPAQAVWHGVERTQFIITSTLGYLSDFATRRQSGDQLGGPARIADIAGKVAKKSPLDLIFLTAFISVSVGLINLFPIPLLDGGHLLFYAAEAAMGRPLSERTQDLGFRIGFAIVLTLMVFAFYNDRTIIRGMFSWLG